MVPTPTFIIALTFHPAQCCLHMQCTIECFDCYLLIIHVRSCSMLNYLHNRPHNKKRLDRTCQYKTNRLHFRTRYYRSRKVRNFRFICCLSSSLKTKHALCDPLLSHLHECAPIWLLVVLLAKHSADSHSVVVVPTYDKLWWDNLADHCLPCYKAGWVSLFR